MIYNSLWRKTNKGFGITKFSPHCDAHGVKREGQVRDTYVNNYKEVI